MAVYNEILAGRFNRALQKLFGMKGPPPTPQLASEIIPVHPFASGAEHRYLEGWERFAIVILQPAVAAQTSGIRFRNPSGSNVMAVFEKVTITNQATQTDQPIVDYGTATADNGTLVSLASTQLDFRSRPTPTLIASRAAPPVSNLAAIWQTAYTAQISYDMIWDEGQEITLGPGFALGMRSAQVNVSLTVSVIWRERALEESERF